MIGTKELFVIILLSLCWTLTPAEEDNEIFNIFNDLEQAPLSYGFEEKLDQMAVSVDELKKSIALLVSASTNIQEELKNLSQTKYQTPDTSCILAGDNSNTKLRSLEVKCPEDRLPESCSEVNECKSDIFSIIIPSYSYHSLAVSCDLKTENGGWTVIQRRQDGAVDFDRNWTEYEQGFGDISGEFFIGLEKLHILTTYKPQELYIILEDFEGMQRYAQYKTFHVGSNDTEYKLTVKDYSGDAGDSLTYHSGEKFSTWDHDNDSGQSNCADKYKGAWWHKSCYESNLNGKYLMGKVSTLKYGQGIAWNSLRGYNYSLRFVQMMIRPRQS